MDVHWLKRLWSGDDTPPAPILLRVANPSGEPPAVLDVEMEWRPSGRRIERSVRTADGLCVLHWRGKEAEAALVVRSEIGSGELVVERARNDGRVIELQLGPAAPETEISQRLAGSSSSL